jgi:putative transposase
MARPLRLAVPGIAHHVIQRGHDRRPAFFHDDDRRFYLALLYETARCHGLAVHAYVLMTNHVHLLATPDTKDALAETVQAIGRKYVQYINTLHERTGTLWEGRYKSSLVQRDEHLAACHAYIELNPVRAGMVRDPSDYEWSSCRHYLGLRTDPVVKESPAYLAGGPGLADRVATHAALLRRGLDPRLAHRIRSRSRCGGVIGNDRFRDEVERMLGRRLPGHPRGRPRKENGV